MANQGFQSPPSTPSEPTLDLTAFSPQTLQDLSDHSFLDDAWNVEDQSFHPYIPLNPEYVNHFDLGRGLHTLPSPHTNHNQPSTFDISALPYSPLDSEAVAVPIPSQPENDLHDALHPTTVTLPPSPSFNSRKRKRIMSDQNPWQQKFACPIFRAEVENGLPHNCNGKGGNTMSEVRRHLTRPSGGYPAHLSFLKRCTTCNKDVIDKSKFAESHGAKCHDPQPLKKKDAAYEQYQALYNLLKESAIVKSKEASPWEPERQTDSGVEATVPSVADTSITHLPLSRAVTTHTPSVVTPLPDLGSKKSYSTPWALLDSDSDDPPPQYETENSPDVEAVTATYNRAGVSESRMDVEDCSIHSAPSCSQSPSTWMNLAYELP
ncbi:uncharacterized protein K460DRAFT_415320 [Cucurbitaria berberidis CBS 394.84]|uniref:Uncharacterized protein n=1 Tax=Cucurbitaria berberidis CBS 394.84 TaxID=1168544 RepID=A0A9P4LB95_9PLEO|nr:uncharacterized protein K460DRAFT_415320 [Cucurbitaria berberidis CBS 394.84]KAF1848840.1 hypothetical protein K460DRAFT_415320 [Cucurbitaria berberidis CBS 394.84]